jgi:succinate-acetate transporter protein
MYVMGQTAKCSHGHYWLILSRDTIVPWTEELMTDNEGLDPISLQLWSELLEGE